MERQSEYLQRAEQFEALAEQSAHEQLKPLYRQLAEQYRSLAAAIARPANIRPQASR